MLLLNFAHPLSETQKDLIQQQTGQAVQRVIEAKAHFDYQRPFATQVTELIDGVGLTSEEWQTQPILLNPPSLTAIASIVLAELHGRMGYFPPVLRLRPVADAVPPQFEVAEIINLQAVRDRARGRR
jgi:hypothetical protein